MIKYIALGLALCLFVDVEAQRRGGRRPQSPRRGRQEGAAAGYAAPSDVPVYGAASDAVPVYDAAAGDDALSALTSNIPGVPGEDYPIYAEVPETAFSCDGQVDGGYYADPEAECQAFHICTADGQGGLAKYSFLCPNGTIFNQNYFICDWWFNFDCSEAEALAAEKNAELAAAREEASASADQASYEAPSADDSYAAPAAAATELPAYDDYEADASLSGYEETTAAPLGGYEAPQEERRRKALGGRQAGRAGRRLQGGNANGRRPNQRAGPRRG